MDQLKVLELFGGIGACSKALERLGIDYKIADYVEIDKYAVKSFNAIHNTNFEPQDITQWDKDIEVDLTMHGSPCQDFSLAGLQAGGDEGSGTRSSLMYETIRIVKKLKPKYVIWENVKNLLSKKHRHNFDAYLEIMESLGYKNYYQVLNAKDYGIPQNRERIFTISIRNDIDKEFIFPEKQELKLKLKDMLEDNVDEKYYLSDKLIENIKINNEKENYIGTYDYAQSDTLRPTMESRTHIDSNVSGALLASGNHNGILIKNATKQGYLEATDGDGIDISGRMEHHRGNVQKDKIQTLTTSGGNDRGVCVKGIATNESKEWQKEPLEEKCRTILANKSNGGVGLIDTELRIRKLTPRECGRLMNVKDEDIDKIQLSDSAMYHIFGDSICTNVLMAIFGELLDINWKQKLEEMLYGNTN